MDPALTKTMERILRESGFNDYKPEVLDTLTVMTYSFIKEFCARKRDALLTSDDGEENEAGCSSSTKDQNVDSVEDVMPKLAGMKPDSPSAQGDKVLGFEDPKPEIAIMEAESSMQDDNMLSSKDLQPKISDVEPGCTDKVQGSEELKPENSDMELEDKVVANKYSNVQTAEMEPDCPSAQGDKVQGLEDLEPEIADMGPECNTLVQEDRVLKRKTPNFDTSPNKNIKVDKGKKLDGATNDLADEVLEDKEEVMV